MKPLEDSKINKPVTQKNRTKNKTIVTSLVMLCTMATRLLGFVRNALINAIFGASGNADVLHAVFTIPNNFRKLLAEGALSSAFIPVLSKTIVDDSTGNSAKRLARNIITFQFVFLIPILALSVIFADPIIELFLEFKEPWKMELAKSLFKWLIFYLFFVSLSAVLMGVLNSNNIFVVPALSPLMFSVVVISSVFFLHETLDIFCIAVGVLGGGLLQIIFQLPFFKKIGYDLKPELGFKNEDFKKVLRLWLPVMATSSIFVVNHQVAIFFASSLEEGSTTFLANAVVFWQLPFGIFSASITTVLFPKMSRQAVKKDNNGLVESVSYGLRFLFAVLIPSTIFFMFFGREIVATVYGRGNFTTLHSIQTGYVLMGYAIGLFSVGGFNFIQRFFYANRDYKTPFWIAFIVMCLDIIISIWLKDTYLRVTGLAVANSVSFTVGIVIMFIFARKRLKRIDGKKIGKTIIKVIFSMIPAAAVLFLYSYLVRELWTEASSFINLALLLGGFVCFSLISLLFYYLTGVEILKDIIARRFKK